MLQCKNCKSSLMVYAALGNKSHKSKVENNVSRGVQSDKYGILCFGNETVVIIHMFMILQFYTKDNSRQHGRAELRVFLILTIGVRLWLQDYCL